MNAVVWLVRPESPSAPHHCTERLLTPDHAAKRS